MSVHSQGPILSCLGDLGLPILAQPSLLPDASCIKAPLEIDQGAEKRLGFEAVEGTPDQPLG